MEMKHTVEILTKDIQDIEKLVRNLNNYTTPPLIELDLAMSKLRRVYELLGMINADIRQELHKSPTPEATVKETTETESAIKEVSQSPQEEIPEVQSKEEKDLAESENAPRAVSNEDIIPAAESTREELPVTHTEAKEEEIIKEEIAAEENVAEIKAEERQSKILAEKFSGEKSLNEKIATGKGDLSSKLKGGKIDSIKRNIGINDRFLIIRELLDGDNEEFNKLVTKLDDCNEIAEALQEIEQRFGGKMEHEGVQILADLSRRKFL